MRRSAGRDLAIVALLAVLAYAPAMSLPLMEDDYGNIGFALDHGAWAQLPALLSESIFRVRATSYWLMYGLWRGFGLAPWAYHAASLVLHMVNCWLVYRIVRERQPEGAAAFFAAAFFAVYEGHQEAVMWFSACNELLAFLFGAWALLLWMRGKWVASAAVFALALVSKESAVIWLPLFVLVERRNLVRLLPHVALAGLAVGAVWITRTYSFRFWDGSFSLHAPFWITWPRGWLRLMWPWGWLSLAAIYWRRVSQMWQPALLWMAIALVPYIFLTYSTQIPSRQTYLASAGLALLVGLAAARLPDRRLLAAAVAVILAVNVGYLWTRKRAQFAERARPTEELIRLARQTNGPIYVQCFPRNGYIAEEAVHIGAGRPRGTVRWKPEPGAVTFCYPGSR